jgi:tRNA(Glu) U13 pseudouridine synthase TruD
LKGGKYLIIPRIDYALGISIYATKTKGLGGIIKKKVEDFIVEEVLVDGSVAKINKKPNRSVLSSSIKRQKYSSLYDCRQS